MAQYPLPLSQLNTRVAFSDPAGAKEAVRTVSATTMTSPLTILPFSIHPANTNPFSAFTSGRPTVWPLYAATVFDEDSGQSTIFPLVMSTLNTASQATLLSTYTGVK